METACSGCNFGVLMNNKDFNSKQSRQRKPNHVLYPLQTNMYLYFGLPVAEALSN